MRRLYFGLVGLGLAIACGESSGPSQPPPVPTSQLHFVVQDPTAPPLVARRDSFWAKVGENRRVRLFYQGATPTDSGVEFLRFEVPSDGLLKRPDGSAFLPGDSILITVEVLDPAKFVFDFQPTGLAFNPDDPARFKVYYYNADPDYNGDGRVDSEDAGIQSKLDIWQRTPPDTVWFELGAVNFESLQELEVKIQHFTDHALAW